MRAYCEEAEALASELAELRHALHRCPELGNREYETATRIETWLRGCGIPTERLLETAVVGRLTGGRAGKTVALRADMDALPLREATGAAFASEHVGVMHACGHDVHMTAALGAAKLLAAHREELPGAVVFLFQPDEEGSGGAQRMIDAGALDGVDAVFGCHVSPDLPEGTVGVRYGKFYAASDTFRVLLTGKSAHGAQREKGIDALAAAAELVTALLALPADFPHDRSVVSVGTLRAGTASNVVAERAELTGILRTLGAENRQAMRAAFRRTVETLASRYGVLPDCALQESYPGVVNDEAMTRLVEGTATALLGAARVAVLAEPTMTTEDFGYFLLQKPGSYYHIGVGGTQPLHSTAFLPRDGAAITAAAVHTALIETYLNGETL